MRYVEAAPDARSAHVVRALWSLAGAAAAVDAEPVAPDGCAELVVHVGDVPDERAEDGGHTRQPRAMVVGPTTRPVFVRPRGVVDTVGVRLQPWATAALFGVPAAELCDRVIAFDELPARPTLRALVAIAESPSASRAGRLQRLLATAAGAAPSPRTSARPLVEAIRASVRPLTVRELADAAGRSVRGVQRSFARDVGMSPRDVLRVARVQRALRLATTHSDWRWIRIAAHAGYFDQAHLVREFRELVGMLPSMYRPDPASLTTVFVERAGSRLLAEDDSPRFG